VCPEAARELTEGQATTRKHEGPGTGDRGPGPSRGPGAVPCWVPGAVTLEVPEAARPRLLEDALASAASAAVCPEAAREPAAVCPGTGDQGPGRAEPQQRRRLRQRPPGAAAPGDVVAKEGIGRVNLDLQIMTHYWLVIF